MVMFIRGYPLNTHEIPVMSHEFPLPGPSPWPEPKSEALPDTLAAAIGAEAARWGKSAVKPPRIQQLDCLSYCLSNCLEVQGFIPAQIWQTIWPLFGGFFHTQIWPGWFWPVLGGQCQLTHCQQVPGRQSQSSWRCWRVVFQQQRFSNKIESLFIFIIIYLSNLSFPTYSDQIYSSYCHSFFALQTPHWIMVRSDPRRIRWLTHIRHGHGWPWWWNMSSWGHDQGWSCVTKVTKDLGWLGCVWCGGIYLAE